MVGKVKAKGTMVRLIEENLGQHREQTRKSGVLKLNVCLSQRNQSQLCLKAASRFLLRVFTCSRPLSPETGLCPYDRHHPTLSICLGKATLWGSVCTSMKWEGSAYLARPH